MQMLLVVSSPVHPDLPVCPMERQGGRVQLQSLVPCPSSHVREVLQSPATPPHVLHRASFALPPTAPCAMAQELQRHRRGLLQYTVRTTRKQQLFGKYTGRTGASEFPQQREEIHADISSALFHLLCSVRTWACLVIPQHGPPPKLQLSENWPVSKALLKSSKSSERLL